LTEIPARIAPGAPFPLGATVRDGGVNFSVFSRHGTRAWVCLFDPAAPARELARLRLPGREGHVFHGFVPELAPGALYGFRVDGPYAPHEGHRFNAHKLLVDPYARALVGDVDWQGPVYGYPPDAHERDLGFDLRDSAAAVPKGLVLADGFDWEGDRPPRIPWSETVVYELHVKGFTRLHPEIPEPLRGTYAGLGHPAAIRELRAVGVTAVELLPIHELVDELHLAQRGLPNYWGYNTLGFFAPAQRYAADRRPGAAVAEFKAMVKALHAAGIEVILDVVYNHTAEGSELGPTLSLRGLDNAVYYHLSHEDRRHCMNFTGTGNAVDASTVFPLRLVMDSLRYWVEEMHVDGFRFDLATTLARRRSDFRYSPDAPLLQAMLQDPVLCRCKLIAEAWDIGPDSYQVGQFPVGFSEWNGRFRDHVRRFWRGDPGHALPFARAFAGSPELYAAGGRGPRASVNFVTAHDGFTLRDLVSYNWKHNEANGEGNRDGSDANDSWNHGHEGETDDPGIRELRDRQRRNLLATLILSRGVPMLLAGDERGRTQRGNNNAYCQDNELSWLDWSGPPDLVGFVRRLLGIRRATPALTADRYLREAAAGARREEQPELVWLRAEGGAMTQDELEAWELRTFGALVGRRTEGGGDERLLVLFNAQDAEVAFALPPLDGAAAWQTLVDTSLEEEDAVEEHAPPGAVFPLAGRSLAVLRPVS
jgi:glycogen operon protein